MATRLSTACNGDTDKHANYTVPVTYDDNTDGSLIHCTTNSISIKSSISVHL